METNNQGLPADPIPGTTTVTTEVQQTQTVPESVVSSLQPQVTQPTAVIPVQPVQVVTPVMPMTSGNNLQPIVTETTVVETKSSNKTALFIILLVLLVVGVVGFILINRNPVGNETAVLPPAPISIPVVKAKTTLIGYGTGFAAEKSPSSISIFDIATSTNTLISGNASDAEISPDGQNLMYISLPVTVDSTEAPTSAIVIYNIATKSTTVWMDSIGALAGVTWSDDGNEIVFDQGTSTVRTLTVYDYTTKAKLATLTSSEFLSVQSQFYWIDKDNIVFMTNVIGTIGKPVSTGGFSGISKINIRTGLITPLLVPAGGAEYSFIGKPVSNGTIPILQTQYELKSSTEANLDSSVGTYYDLDLTTGAIVENKTLVDQIPEDVIRLLLPSEKQLFRMGSIHAAKETGVYYMVLFENNGLDNSKGNIYKVDTNSGVTNPVTLIETGSDDISSISLF